MRLLSSVFASVVLLQVVLASIILPVDASTSDYWNKSWSFYEQIRLDVNTGEPGFSNQPVDVHVVFSNPCWARDEYNNSVRVVVKYYNEWRELESQIYNLSFVDDCHINACNLVFLIPSYADGSEKYYLYYDDDEKPPVSYVDHVSVREDYFYYEPISGYKVDLRYYKVVEDGYCLYGVGLEGEIAGLGVANKVIKQRNYAVDFSPRNWVQVASFAFFYAAKGTNGVGTDKVLVSKEILVDGNLMVRFRVSSKSSDGKLKTDAMYTYYYCPTGDKRLVVDVHDEVVSDAVSSGTAAQGGSFAYLASSKTRSANIKELNSGFIPPYVHFFSEQNVIQGYHLPQNPHSSDYEWVLSPQDDADLGSKAWVSLDEGRNGYAYAII
ncbi:MAG TPA: carboxypeptidase regulatory-like domain-containing protein, partial [Thermoplasmatales archaeon]|nr:carboxypeptidase regulatory-like domain-containing protein [Thermoplasmatales archaeon]